MSKFKLACALAVIVTIAFLGIRTYQWSACQVKGYDLKRDTEISWLTGKCTTPSADGKRIYTDQIRGVE